MVELLTSIFAGGATGIFGSFINRIFGFFEKREERKFVLQKYKLDAEARTQEHEYHMEEARLEANSKALQASYAHDSSIGVASTWVINILRLVRPLLTVFLIILSASVIFHLSTSDQLNSAQANYIIQSILYLTTTAITWWFGDRSRVK